MNEQTRITLGVDDSRDRKLAANPGVRMEGTPWFGARGESHLWDAGERSSQLTSRSARRLRGLAFLVGTRFKVPARKR
jgi:hypothetical protein